MHTFSDKTTIDKHTHSHTLSHIHTYAHTHIPTAVGILRVSWC